MYVKRLSWAGIAVVSGPTRILIDPLADAGKAARFLGEVSQTLISAEEIGRADYALITHLHQDHYDKETLRYCLGENGRVVCHKSVADRVERDGFRVQPVELNEDCTLGPLTVMAVPAVDGLGQSQVSWVVAEGETRIIHCGDTLWHGYWWTFARELGPFDLAFLPINGALVQFPRMIPSGIPASLTPEQAVAAGKILGARAVCPIHYGLFHSPPVYVDQPDAERRFLDAAREQVLPVRRLAPGDLVNLG